MAKTKTLLRKILVIAFWVGLWWLLAAILGKPLLLPSPPAVLRRITELILSARFWSITSASLGRIMLGALIAFVSGTLLAIITSRSRLMLSLFSPVLTVIKSTPVASFIILVLIWVGRDVVPILIVLLMALPVVWANVSAGIASTDPLLIEMAHVFHFSKLKMLKCIYVPSVMPDFLAACRSCLGLAWKSGVAAEILTVPAKSIGKMIYESKLYLETVDLFAWTGVVIICSLIIEKVLMAAIGRIAGKKFPGGHI